MADCDWSRLPSDLLFTIGKKVSVSADRFSFRLVCKSWSSSISPFPQPPWLMLAQSETGIDCRKEDDEVEQNITTTPPRGFVGFGSEQEHLIYDINLPQVYQTNCVGSSGNWLVTIDKTSNMHLLNIFSRVEINLPSESTFLYGIRTKTNSSDLLDFLVKVVISSTPSIPSSSSSSNCSNDKDCIAMAIHYYEQELAIARPGDASWTTLELPVEDVTDDMIFYKEQFYIITYAGVLIVCDIGDDLDSAKLTIVPVEGFGFLCTYNETSCFEEKKYLVEWLGELVLVIKVLTDPWDDYENRGVQARKIPPSTMYKTVKFHVFKLDFTNKKWVELNGLGEHSFFLGINTSTSLLACNYPGSLKKNCIYFTDDYQKGYCRRFIGGGQDMGVFDMEDKSIKPHYKGISTSYYSPPIWVIPNLPVK